MDDKGNPASGRTTPLKRAVTPNSDNKSVSAISEASLGLKFESKGLECSYDLTTEKMRQPRMYTMHQLRDLFYGMLNQSHVQS